MRSFAYIIFFLFSCSNHSKIEQGTYLNKIGKYHLEYTIKGKGPLLIVGHPTSGKIAYEGSLQPLEKYFTVVYYNARGIGKSDTPPTYDEYQDKVWLFGHSDQSALALQYAVDYPRHVNGLILSGTGYIDSYEEIIEDRKVFEMKRKNTEKWFQQVVNDWDYMLKFQTKTDSLGRDLTYAPLKWWCYDESSFQKVKPIYDSIIKIGKRREVSNQVNSYSTEHNIKNYIPYQPKFNQIKVPILIINGKYDTNNSPKKVEKLHHALPNSDLYIIDKSGHFPWIEQYEESFKIIEEWLIKQL